MSPEDVVPSAAPPVASRAVAGRAPRPLRLAHRGDHCHHPENSIAAAVAAMALPRIDGVEFDVRFSADGEPIVLHDETLDRVQGVAGVAADLSAAELARVGVPSLADVLAAMPVDAYLDIELKGVPNERFATVLRAVRGERPIRAAVSSFHVDALTATGAILPGWPRWLNAVRVDPGTLAAAARLDCRGIAVDHAMLDAAATTGARSAGLVVAAWTVTSAADERRVTDLGVDIAIVEGAAIGQGPRVVD